MQISPVKIWRNQKKIKTLLGKEGSIISFTIIRVPPAGFEDQAPYAVAVIKIGKEHQVGQLVDIDVDLIKIGQKVVSVLRRVRSPEGDGVIPYGVKFRIKK